MSFISGNYPGWEEEDEQARRKEAWRILGPDIEALNKQVSELQRENERLRQRVNPMEDTLECRTCRWHGMRKLLIKHTTGVGVCPGCHKHGHSSIPELVA